MIVANSGRMLAQAARSNGLKPLVIDLFADLDMQNYAEDFRQVKSLAESDLAASVEYFIERYAVTRVIYGSGFEYYPQSLYYLNSRLMLLGNYPDVFARQLDKQFFFSTLEQFNVPHPEVVFSVPDCADGWLLKPMQGQGGIGIQRYQAGDDAKTSGYWQKFQAGTPHSVLFLADGKQLQVIGFNSQWPVRLSESQAFVFSGVINSCDLPDVHKARVTNWLQQLVPAFTLKGLNSLDFIYKDECSYVLEINPRPSASMQLYDEDLLSRHIQACIGEGLINVMGRKVHSILGYQIVYAECDLMVPGRFEWPEWCMDLPTAGSFFRTGQPICSIIAHQNESGSVAKQLLIKQQHIISQLERF